MFNSGDQQTEVQVLVTEGVVLVAQLMPSLLVITLSVASPIPLTAQNIFSSGDQQIEYQLLAIEGVVFVAQLIPSLLVIILCIAEPVLDTTQNIFNSGDQQIENHHWLAIEGVVLVAKQLKQ